jgi:spore germination protein GerM
MILAALPTQRPTTTPTRRRVLVHLTGRNGLIPVQRDVPGTGAEVEQALRALLRGPTPFELADGIGTEVPAGSELLGVEVDDGVAVVDLAPAFAAGGATASVRRRVQQIVHTATACAGIVSVRLRLGGVPVVTLGGGGLLVSGALTRQAADTAKSA